MLLSERERLFIEQGGPKAKATLNFEYAQGTWSGNTTFVHNPMAY